MEPAKKEYPKIDGEVKKQLQAYVYDIVGAMQEVHNELGSGLPEYVYQEALVIALKAKGFDPIREMQMHPIFRGVELETYLKMDLVVPLERENVIIECKAKTSMGEQEHYQLFGYMRATGMPIGILVNFGTHPKAVIERYYWKDGVMWAF